MSTITVADLRLLALGKAVELQHLLEALVEAEGKAPVITCASIALDVVESLVPEPWDAVGEDQGSSPPPAPVVDNTREVQP